MIAAKVVTTLMFSNFLTAFWRVKVLFQVPHEPLAPLWVARLCHAKYCNCNCYHPLPCGTTRLVSIMHACVVWQSIRWSRHCSVILILTAVLWCAVL